MAPQIRNSITWLTLMQVAWKNGKTWKTTLMLREQKAFSILEIQRKLLQMSKRKLIKLWNIILVLQVVLCQILFSNYDFINYDKTCWQIVSQIYTNYFGIQGSNPHRRRLSAFKLKNLRQTLPKFYFFSKWLLYSNQMFNSGKSLKICCHILA